MFCNSDFKKSIYFGKNYLNILKLLPFTKYLINLFFCFILVFLFKITFIIFLSQNPLQFIVVLTITKNTAPNEMYKIV